ncbi:hypothetical protein WICPIJ_006612 [Wickerhamomyces pijperi]|uniref:Uncharacterized protein n=1 Tax=Wickerhamomyces pijperi TaxID=599730 RepID=A0A9P8TKQ9_WICPI|nr:hypothetical protein WICPIJ_006612 [Wickerhamomyces pijperi]
MSTDRALPYRIYPRSPLANLLLNFLKHSSDNSMKVKDAGFSIREVRPFVDVVVGVLISKNPSSFKLLDLGSFLPMIDSLVDTKERNPRRIKIKDIPNLAKSSGWRTFKCWSFASGFSSKSPQMSCMDSLNSSSSTVEITWMLSK